MSLASLHLVLRSTNVATAALRTLGSIKQVFPDGAAVVQESLKQLTRSLVRVDFSVPPQLPPSRRAKAPPLPTVPLFINPPVRVVRRDHALIEQEIHGCKTLLLEVIRRAAHDWVLYRTSRRMLQKKLAEDAFTWLFVEKPGHPNWIERERQGKHLSSFLSICSELDLDADNVRTYIRRLTLKNVLSVGRPAESRRRDPCLPTIDESHLPALASGISEWDPIDVMSVD